MDLSGTLILTGLIVALLWLLGLRSRRASGLPPGPPALPLVGNLLQLDKRAPFKTLLKVRAAGSPLARLHQASLREHVFPPAQ